MEITVEITKDEHQYFIREYYLKRNWAKRIAVLAIIALALSFLGLRSIEDVRTKLLEIFVFFITILMLLFCAIPYVIWYFQMKNILGRQTAEGPVKWLFNVSTTGVQLNDEQESKFFPWGKVDIIARQDFIILKPLSKEVYFLPLSVFGDHSSAEFLELVKSYRKTPANKLPNPKPLYFMGIICLIPFIGAALGFVYVILGFQTYKNKAIVAIGFMGLIITGVVVFNIIKSIRIEDAYEKLDPQTASQVAPKGYWQLFAGNDKPTLLTTSNTKLRNPISEFAYKDYRCVVYKIDSLHNSNVSLGNIIKENYNDTKTNYGSYRGIGEYNDTPDLYVQMAVPDKPDRIFLNLFGQHTHTITKNDSVAYYSSDFKNFFIKYKPDGGEEFYGKASKQDDDNAIVPLELMFLKRNRNLYFILMFANKSASKLPAGTLNSMLTKVN